MAEPEYVSALEGKMGKEETEAKINERIEGFHGLLTKEAAAKLIASEMGLVERQEMKISELKEGMGEVDLEGRIEEVGKMRSFASGAVLRAVTVSDGSGEIQVNFWGEEAKKAGKMHVLDTLEIRKGYVKMGRVNIGYKSAYRVSKGAEVIPVGEVDGKEPGERFNAMGKVEQIDGMEGDSFMFAIGDKGKSIPVSLVNAPSKGEHLQVGDSVLLEGVEYSGGRILVEGRARMLLRKNRDNIFRGKLDGIRQEGEGIFIIAGGEKFATGKEGLARFLKLGELRDDISLDALIEMKLPDIRGKDIFIVFREKDGIKEIEEAELR